MLNTDVSWGEISCWVETNRTDVVKLRQADWWGAQTEVQVTQEAWALRAALAFFHCLHSVGLFAVRFCWVFSCLVHYFCSSLYSSVMLLAREGGSPKPHVLRGLHSTPVSGRWRVRLTVSRLELQGFWDASVCRLCAHSLCLFSSSDRPRGGASVVVAAGKTPSFLASFPRGFVNAFSMFCSGFGLDLFPESAGGRGRRLATGTTGSRDLSPDQRGKSLLVKCSFCICTMDKD